MRAVLRGATRCRSSISRGLRRTFHVTFEGEYSLAVFNGDLQVKEPSGRVVETVKPTIVAKSGKTIAGTSKVESPRDFSFTSEDVLATGKEDCSTGHHRQKRWSGWGSFWCSTVATVSGAVGGAFLGGPFGLGFGLGTGIAAAASC